MKKLLTVMLLITTVGLISCQRERNEPQVNHDYPTETGYTGYESQTESPDDNGSSTDNALDSVVDPIREFDVARGEHGYLAVRYIEHMQEILPNRLAFTDRELESAEWIVETLIAMGFNEDQIQMQSFAIDTPTSSWWGDALWMVEMYESMGYYDGLERIDVSQNVILTIPGRSEETIIIGAHYDGVGNPGISDNAGGVALLLESAYRMRDVDHYYTLQYIFFGAEEVGLIGAFYFVDNMSAEEIDNLVLMINADVILDGPNLIYAVGYVAQMPDYHIHVLWNGDISQSELTLQIDSFADELNENYQTELIPDPYGIFLSTDQLAFIQFEIPVMVFYGTHPTDTPGGFIGDVLHTPNDDLDFIMDNHPGRIERAFDSFGRLLEVVLSSEF